MNAADDVGAEVDVDVEEPQELLLDPVEPDLAVPPEQWEVLADEEPPPPPPDAPAPPVAVPVLHHIVEAPVFDPAPMPEPAPDHEPEPEEEPDFDVFAPVTTHVIDAPPAAPLEVLDPVAPAATAAPAAIEHLPPSERATSAVVLLLLAVVVGIALAGLVSAVVLVLTVLVRRALGA